MSVTFGNRVVNFSEIIKSLSSASAFDLYRMRAAIDRVLDEPRWLQSVQVRLKVGQDVQYFDPQSNALRRGRLLEMRRKQAVVLDLDDARRLLISYSAINLDGTDVQIRENKAKAWGATRSPSATWLDLSTGIRINAPAKSFV